MACAHKIPILPTSVICLKNLTRRHKAFELQTIRNIWKVPISICWAITKAPSPPSLITPLAND